MALGPLPRLRSPVGAPAESRYGPGSDGVVLLVDSGTLTAQY